jgi:hypothetical protein
VLEYSDELKNAIKLSRQKWQMLVFCREKETYPLEHLSESTSELVLKVGAQTLAEIRSVTHGSAR